MSLPGLATLSLATPTGARTKATPSRVRLADPWQVPAQPGSHRESGGEPPPLDPSRPNFINELPFAMHQLVAHHLMALAQGNPSKLCKDLAS